MYKNKIIKLLQQASGEKDVSLDIPTNSSFGDYSTNVAMVLGKKKGINPEKLAKKIVGKLNENKESKILFADIKIEGPGFINLYLKDDVLVDSLKQISKEKNKFGSSDFGSGKLVVVDYSAPNIAKPFGIGHLRSTVIGQAIYNLFAFSGYRVIGDNHLGDWGTQFGKLLYMIDKNGGITDSVDKDFDIEKLEKLYVQFHVLEAEDSSLSGLARAWFKKLENGDKKARDIWQKCVDVSMAEFDSIYKLLEVKLDYAYGESFYQDLMDKMLQSNSLLKHISTGEDGKSKIINLEKFVINTPLMFLKSDGATTYATRDLATIKFRMQKWNPEIIVYEVGAEQTLHFRQLFAAAKLIGLVNDDVKLIHTGHGLYLAPDGKKFSTRKGSTVKLEEVLNEAIIKAKELGSTDGKTAQMVGIGAIKYFDLSHGVSSNVVFDWKKVLNMEGNSGPYIQYSVARTNSVIKKAKDEKQKPQKEVIMEKE
ncbi:arginine--tRNA ligase, partial [Candidatus Microgenomates bacterium]|nr:arginine--tRNA ligase [Candidatus Microgenomates bacterium]